MSSPSEKTGQSTTPPAARGTGTVSLIVAVVAGLLALVALILAIVALTSKSSTGTGTGTGTSTESLEVTGTTNATSSSSGALIVDGGVGLAKDLWVGGQAYLQGATYTEDFFYTPIYSANYTTSATVVAHDMNKGVIVVPSGTGAITLTMDTGTNVYNEFTINTGGIIPFNNQAKRMMIVNQSSNTVIIDNAPSGATFALSNSTIPAGITANFIIQITGTNTYQMYGGI